MIAPRLASSLNKWIPMAIKFKVRAHCLKMGRILRTEGKFFEGVWNAAIVGQHAKAGIMVRLLCPSNEALDVLALPDLTVADLVLMAARRHRGVIGKTHDVLAQGIQAVQGVLRVNNLLDAVLVVLNGSMEIFLSGKRTWSVHNVINLVFSIYFTTQGRQKGRSR